MEKNKLRQEKRITAQRVILTSFFVDLLDIVLNLFTAIISGSVIMLSQLLEGIADLTASGFLFIGHKRSHKKEDKAHPFGYGREVYFWTLLSALLMFGVTSSFSFYLGWQRFLHPEPIKSTELAILVLLLTFFTNLYALFLSLKRLLRSRNIRQIFTVFRRSSLVETKTTLILDLMGSSSSLLGMVALSIYLITGDLRFDGVGAMIIGSTLAILSVFLLLGIKDLLIGRSASPATEEKIKKLALEIPEVEEVLDLKTLHIGPDRLLVNLDVHMESELSTDELEKIIDKIQDNITKEVPSVKYIQVEIETP